MWSANWSPAALMQYVFVKAFPFLPWIAQVHIVCRFLRLDSWRCQVYLFVVCWDCFVFIFSSKNSKGKTSGPSYEYWFSKRNTDFHKWALCDPLRTSVPWGNWEREEGNKRKERNSLFLSKMCVCVCVCAHVCVLVWGLEEQKARQGANIYSTSTLLRLQAEPSLWYPTQA